MLAISYKVEIVILIVITLHFVTTNISLLAELILLSKILGLHD